MGDRRTQNSITLGIPILHGSDIMSVQNFQTVISRESLEAVLEILNDLVDDDHTHYLLTFEGEEFTVTPYVQPVVVHIDRRDP